MPHDSTSSPPRDEHGPPPNRRIFDPIFARVDRSNAPVRKEDAYIGSTSRYPLPSFSRMSASAAFRAAVSVGNDLRLCWPALPMRPNETTSSVPSTVTCQYFRDVPPMNSKRRVWPGGSEADGAGPSDGARSGTAGSGTGASRRRFRKGSEEQRPAREPPDRPWAEAAS